MPGNTDRYGSDVLSTDWRAPKRGRAVEIDADKGLVVEEVTTDWCGEIVAVERDLMTVTLEDRRGRRRTFPLGTGFLYVKQERIAPICIGPDDDMDQRRKDIAKAIAKVDDGSGVIILTDLFGGTPSNLAISLLKAGKTEVIAGINLPMLIRLAGARKDMGLAAAAKAARDAGRNYITIASEFLGQDA